MKRIVTVLLIICFAFALVSLSPSSSADSICFIAVNDTLLELSSTPYFSGGVTYVPYHVFTDYGIKMYFSYFSDTSSAMLYTSSRQLFFDMKSDTAYDDSGKTYQAKAVLRNGTVYLPAAFVCDFFGGMACSYVSGSGWGDLVRIKDANAFLDNKQFIQAASTLMQMRMEAYSGGQEVQPSPYVTENIPNTQPSGNAVLYLGFTGLPTEGLLSALSRCGAGACFFLTSEEILSAPDTVRRLECEGYSIGILLSDDMDEDYSTASSLIYDAAQVKVILVTSVSDPNAAEEYADRSSLAYWRYASVSPERLDSGAPESSILLNSGDYTYTSAVELFRHALGEFTILAPSEVT